MLAIEKTYTDLFGTERKNTFYFHISKTELVKLEGGITGGFINKIQTIMDTKDIPELMKTFDYLIDISYGERSADGNRFMKSKEITTAFKQTQAYDQIFMELYTDADRALEFFNGIMPSDLVENANIPSITPVN